MASELNEKIAILQGEALGAIVDSPALLGKVAGKLGAALGQLKVSGTQGVAFALAALSLAAAPQQAKADETFGYAQPAQAQPANPGEPMISSRVAQGIGAVLGAVAGGATGSLIGGGKGKVLAMGVGAAIGGLAGGSVAKSMAGGGQPPQPAYNNRQMAYNGAGQQTVYPPQGAINQVPGYGNMGSASMQGGSPQQQVPTAAAPWGRMSPCMAQFNGQAAPQRPLSAEPRALQALREASAQLERYHGKMIQTRQFQGQINTDSHAEVQQRQADPWAVDGASMAQQSAQQRQAMMMADQKMRAAAQTELQSEKQYVWAMGVFADKCDLAASMGLDVTSFKPTLNYMQERVKPGLALRGAGPLRPDLATASLQRGQVAQQGYSGPQYRSPGF